jgi:hypothetical protein
MNKLAIFAFAALASSPVLAGNHIDDRGYRVCEQSLTEQFGDNGVVYKRHYMVKRSADERTFYINKTIWNEGIRTPVASTCVTSVNGRDILDLESDYRPHVDIEDVVAAR